MQSNDHFDTKRQTETEVPPIQVQEQIALEFSLPALKT
jgi:hypothetical protein